MVSASDESLSFGGWRRGDGNRMLAEAMQSFQQTSAAIHVDFTLTRTTYTHVSADPVQPIMETVFHNGCTLKNGSDRILGAQQVQDGDLASRFPRSHSKQASVGCLVGVHMLIGQTCCVAKRETNTILHRWL